MQPECDPLETLVAECVQRMDEHGEGALEAMCEEHPSHAAALQRRVRCLLQFGMVGIDEASPARVGPYRIIERIGSGGMGEVFLAEQEEPLRRRVALKMIRRGRDSQRVLARFALERQALAQLNHDGIAKIFDAGTSEEGRPYMVMELVDGEPLTAYCKRHQATVDQRLELFAAVCDAVQHAHQNGLVHRDLKPANILVSDAGGEGVPKVIDFGLAKALEDGSIGEALATQAGHILGTIEYMSPEQADTDRGPVDTRSDVYSLGVVLFELLTGHLPFDLGSFQAAGVRDRLATICELRFPRPSHRVAALGPDWDAVPFGLRGRRALVRRLVGDLDWICGKALEKDPARRYGAVAGLSDDIRRHLQEAPVMAGPPTWSYVLGKLVRRHRLAVGAAVVLVLTLVVSLVVVAKLAASRQSALERFDLMERGDRYRELIRREELGMWPAHPSGLAQMQTWAGAMTAVVEEESRILRVIDEVRREDGVESSTGEWRFTDARNKTLHDVLVKLVPRLQEQRELEHGALRSMRRRIVWASELAARTTEAHAAVWDEVCREVAEDSDFDGWRLTPQVGLVPLGRDPESDLFEFAHLLPGGIVPTRDRDGRLRVTAETCPVLVLVPGEKGFPVGAQNTDSSGPNYDPDATPQEEALQRRDVAHYLIGKYELSRGQWRLMTGRDPTEKAMSDSLVLPVSTMGGSRAEYVLRVWGLRLPSETVWEHAARGGTTDRYWTGHEVSSLRGAANLADMALGRAQNNVPEGSVPWDDGYVTTAPVNALRANDYGLHNMHGNVSEFMERQVDITKAKNYFRRGGNWFGGAGRARASFRLRMTLTQAVPTVGCRAARALDSIE